MIEVTFPLPWFFFRFQTGAATAIKKGAQRRLSSYYRHNSKFVYSYFLYIPAIGLMANPIEKPLCGICRP
jgi:hypothetical protein